MSAPLKSPVNPPPIDPSRLAECVSALMQMSEAEFEAAAAVWRSKR